MNSSTSPVDIRHGQPELVQGILLDHLHARTDGYRRFRPWTRPYPGQPGLITGL